MMAEALLRLSRAPGWDLLVSPPRCGSPAALCPQAQRREGRPAERQTRLQTSTSCCLQLRLKVDRTWLCPRRLPHKPPLLCGCLATAGLASVELLDRSVGLPDRRESAVALTSDLCLVTCSYQNTNFNIWKIFLIQRLKFVFLT